MSVVKANAYGHGLLRTAKALEASDGFAVLGINEAIELREAGFRQAILLLEGLFSPAELAAAIQHKLTLVVHCEQQLHMLEACREEGRVNVYLKVNTGMNRLGVPVGQFWSFFDRLKVCKTVGQVTLMTHFATADEPAGVADQFALFDELTREISRPRSMANSAAILRYPHTHADWVRPGIMLYGASPFSGLAAAKFGLQPTMTLSSAIIAVQRMQVGQSLGYGHRFTAKKPMRIGVVACGYADGYPRHAPNGTPVAVAGSVTQTLGRVSMDMLYVDLSDLPDADIGSPVELWGERIPVDTVAEAAGTVGYELLCAVAPRVRLIED